jgi:succinoglycan biosynthesis transport protein ExoP
MSLPALPAPPVQSSELNLHELLDALRRRKATFIQVFLVVLAAGIFAAAPGKPVYQTQAKLLVPTGSYAMNLIDSNNPIAAMLAMAQPDSMSTQLQALQSPEFQGRAFKAARIQSRPEVIPPSFSAEAVGDANVLQITAEGGDPKEVAALANAAIELHARDTKATMTTGMEGTLEFVKAEKLKTDRQFARAEQQLLKFRQEHRVAELASERQGRAAEYAALLARVMETGSNLNSTRTQVASLRQRLAREPARQIERVTRPNPLVGKIQEKLVDLRFQRMDLLREYRPTSRPVRDLDGQIARLEQQLAGEAEEIQLHSRVDNPSRAHLQLRLEELEATLQALEEDYHAAMAQYNARKGLLTGNDQWEADLARLTRERDTLQATQTELAGQLRNLEIRERAGFPGARIIQRAAVPSSPMPPRRTMSLGLSVMLALLLAFGTVMLQEYLDDRVNSSDEVERLTGLPTLAYVPAIVVDQPHMVSNMPVNSPVAEAYRALRVGIGFAGADTPIRRLQFTSPTKGEGKSTTSANLATAMAQDGKKVILVDADLRSPSLHRLFGLPLSPGLSEALAGMIGVGEVLRTTDVENLLVVPAGTIPPNPAELLGSPAFLRLLDQLEEQADVVIFDTPPCVPVTDPVIIAARMDGVVLVLYAGHTRKAAIKRAIELLGRARARMVGALFNQVKSHGRGYYYQQYYSYGEGAENGGTARERKRLRNGRHPEETGTATAAATWSGDEMKES